MQRDERMPIRLRVSWILLAVWLASYVAAPLLKGSAAAAAVGIVQSLALLVVVVLHGSLANGWRGFAVYAAITATVAFVMEASSIANGFPFGFYTHNVSMPKALGVPPHVVIGYVVLGWLAWNVAKVIVRAEPTDADGIARFTTPLVATFILAGFDFSYDAIGSTALGLWTYREPSGTFGVPLKNFFGWLLTGWTFLQSFALIERRFPSAMSPTSKSLWALPCAAWFGLALQFPVLFATAAAGTVTRGDRTFFISDVYEAALTTSLFTLVFTSALGFIRLASPSTGSEISRK